MVLHHAANNEKVMPGVQQNNQAATHNNIQTQTTSEESTSSWLSHVLRLTKTHQTSRSQTQSKNMQTQITSEDSTRAESDQDKATSRSQTQSKKSWGGFLAGVQQQQNMQTHTMKEREYKPMYFTFTHSPVVGPGRFGRVKGGSGRVDQAKCYPVHGWFVFPREHVQGHA